MLNIIDFRSDNSDDIVINSGNIETEFDTYTNSLLVAQRRICARLDDYPTYSNASAGLEQFLFKSNVLKYSYDIKRNISNCLYRDGILSEANLKIDVIDTKTTTAKLLVHFIFPYEKSNRAFRVFVDHHNQRIYRGQ
jgi:hypothetical protein